MPLSGCSVPEWTTVNGRRYRLFVETNLSEPTERVLKTAQLWAQLQLRLGEQRIDIILAATSV